MFSNHFLLMILAAPTNAATISQEPPSPSLESFDCGYRSSAEWLAEFQASIARGEIDDPALIPRPRIPPSAARDSSARVDPNPCLGPNQLFLFEDTDQVMQTDYSFIQLLRLMVDAANAVVATYGDQYDNIGYWLSAVPHHQEGAAFYAGLKNEVLGIGDSSGVGTPIYDFHDRLGLAGVRINGFLMMFFIDDPEWQPGTGANADFTRLGLGHEVEHQWALYLPPLQNGRLMQGDDGACSTSGHWNGKVDGQGSCMYLREWVGANPAIRDGIILRFNTDTGGLYSYTDLYLMGYVSPAEMDAGNSELRYMDNSPCTPTYPGVISNFSSTDIVAVAGPRVPDSTSAQKDFRTAWIVIHPPMAPPTQPQKDKVIAILQQQQVDFHFGTLGLGTVNHTLFRDCNCNDVADETDIAGGTSLDANHNEIPDTCEAAVGSSFCEGDGSGAACPCGNSGTTGHGCANSSNAAGALLAATGTQSPDEVALDATGLRPSTLTVFFKGDANLGSPLTFGDGLRCVGGALRRFGAQTSVNGMAGYPGPFATPLSSAGGNTPGSGQVAYYQAFYRDGDPAFCTIERLNASNGVQIVW